MAYKFSEGELARLSNLTQVSITANSNKPISTQDEWDTFSSEMQTLLETHLFGEDDAVGDAVFGKAPFVQQVRAASFGLEIGSKQHRAHFHLVVEIRHVLQKYSIRKFRDRFKEYLDKNYGAEKGISNWNVYTKLTPSYQINYANKESRWRMNDEMEKHGRGQPEKTRLEDSRGIQVVKEGKARVLEGNDSIIDKNGHRSYNKSQDS